MVPQRLSYTKYKLTNVFLEFFATSVTELWLKQPICFCSGMHTCVHIPHTHLKDCKAEWPNPHWMQNPSTGQQLSQQSQHQHLHCISETAIAANNFQFTFIQPMHLLVIDFVLAHRLLRPLFIHLCSNLYAQHQGSLVHVAKQTGWVGWIAHASEGPIPWGPEWHTNWVCYPVCQGPIPETNTRQCANRALSRIHETKQGQRNREG